MITANVAKCYCDNCGEYILDIDLDVLESPLKGHMFKQREDTEWAIFHETYEESDLTCPICEWLMHNEGFLTIELQDGDKFMKLRGTADDIRSMVRVPEKEPVKPVITFRCRNCKKEIPEGKYCSDECQKAHFEKQSNPKQGVSKSGKKYNVENAHKVRKGEGEMNNTKRALEELLDG